MGPSLVSRPEGSYCALSHAAMLADAVFARHHTLDAPNILLKHLADPCAVGLSEGRRHDRSMVGVAGSLPRAIWERPLCSPKLQDVASSNVDTTFGDGRRRVMA